MLYVGEGTQGSQKLAAVFPGLEFLQGQQESSSLRDFTNDWRFRMAPHPFRVTVGAPSVTTQDGTVALFWDPNFRWNEADAGMTAMFASPNRVADVPAWQEAGDNHLLGIFVPSIPRYVPENHSLADAPYVGNRAGHPVALEARVWLSASTDPTAAVRRFIEVNGLPEVVPPPLGAPAVRDLCRAAYLETLWNPRARVEVVRGDGKLRARCLGRAAVATRRRTADDSMRTTLLPPDEVAKVRHAGPRGGDPTWTKTPYFLGLFDGETLKWLEAEVREALNSQQSDGSWHYVPLPLPEMFASCPPLGQASDVSVLPDRCGAGQLLRWANITGDDKAKEAGLKGLRYLAGGQQLVPQGAPFEDPAASAYLWSSGLAVEAFVEGYRATGDADLLAGAPLLGQHRIAVRVSLEFAKRGPAAIRHDRRVWVIVLRPCLLVGASRAVARFGVCLCPAPLAPLDATFPWTTVADGITTSALWQLGTDADKRGLYPDSVEGAGDMAAPGFAVRYGLWIQPDLILKNLLAAEGHDPEISFRHIESGRSAYGSHRRTTRCRDARRAAHRLLTLTAQSAPGDTPCTAVAGFGRPQCVTCDGRELPEVPAGNSTVPAGWMFDQPRGLIYIKTSFTHPTLTIRLFRDAGQGLRSRHIHAADPVHPVQPLAGETG